VIDNRAQGVKATGSGTGIATALLLAGKVGRTVGVYGTLGATVGRSAKVGGQTTAGGSSLIIPALGILATR